MIDTMIADHLILDKKLLSDIRLLIKKGIIELSITHIQEDQLRAMTNNPEKTAKYQVIEDLILPMCTTISTSGIVLGISRLGRAAFGSVETGNLIKSIQNNNTRHIQDALIAATAKQHEMIFVTDEKTLPKNIRKAKSDQEVWSYNTFCSWITQQVTNIN
jgi:predicted nucleic acid-binding protein